MISAKLFGGARAGLCLWLLSGSLSLSGCAQLQTLVPPAQVALTLSSASATLLVGGAAQEFRASLSGSSAPVSWSLSPQVGSLSSTTGAVVSYTPPAQLAQTQTVTLTARAAGLERTVTLTLLAQPVLTVSPPEALFQAGGPAQPFSATLQGASDPVSWSLSPQVGSLSSTTGAVVSYTPPAQLAQTQTVTLTARAGTLERSVTLTVNPAPVLEPRPQGSPDVVILSVSGRCNTPCNAPADNWAYLAAPNWNTVGQVKSAFESLGQSVQTFSYSSALSSHTSNAAENQFRPSSEQGFLQLEAKLQEVYAAWMRGKSNPTRIVLLGHSYGVNWTHQLSRASPGIPIAYLIDLDGIALSWSSENAPDIGAYVAQQGRNPWPFALEQNTQVYAIPGKQDRYSVVDVAENNVQHNLEVRSSTAFNVVCLLSDALPNVRPDGSSGGIYTHKSSECHSNVAFGSGSSIAWVKSRILELK